MDVLVLDRCRVVAEALPAGWAGVGLLARVCAPVRHQVRGPAEGLAALLAFAGLARLTVHRQALLAALRGGHAPLSGLLWEVALLGFQEVGVR